MLVLVLLTLVAGNLQASDEAPESYDNYFRIMQAIDSYAPVGYDPVYVAHLSPQDPVRLGVLQRHRQHVQARRSFPTFDRIAAVVFVATMAACVYYSITARPWHTH